MSNSDSMGSEIRGNTSVIKPWVMSSGCRMRLQLKTRHSRVDALRARNLSRYSGRDKVDRCMGSESSRRFNLGRQPMSRKTFETSTKAGSAKTSVPKVRLWDLMNVVMLSHKSADIDPTM